MSPRMTHSSHRPNLFHTVGPATEKEQSPNFVEDRGTGSRFFDDDRSRLSAALMQNSVM